MYKSTNTTWSTTFPLDKSRKKDYTESTQMKLNLAAFDDDEVAGSADIGEVVRNNWGNFLTTMNKNTHLRRRKKNLIRF